MALGLLIGSAGSDDRTSSTETVTVAGQVQTVRGHTKTVRGKTRTVTRVHIRTRTRTKTVSVAAAPVAVDGDADQSDGACDPSYEGACLDPNSYDYDCEGGSGDGPDYTGTVTVVGDDHFDLDRDGDGIACDD